MEVGMNEEEKLAIRIKCLEEAMRERKLKKDRVNAKIKKLALDDVEMFKNVPVKVVIEASCTGSLRMQMVVDTTKQDFIALERLLRNSNLYDYIVETFARIVIICVFTHRGEWVVSCGETKKEALANLPED
jgi:hypothetical protein